MYADNCHKKSYSETNSCVVSISAHNRYIVFDAFRPCLMPPSCPLLPLFNAPIVSLLDSLQWTSRLPNIACLVPFAMQTFLVILEKVENFGYLVLIITKDKDVEEIGEAATHSYQSRLPYMKECFWDILRSTDSYKIEENILYI